MKGHLFIVLVGLCIIFSGCGDGGKEAQYFMTTLTLKDQSGKETTDFSQGENITFELSITNGSDSPKSLTLASPQTYEFIVAPTGETQPIWHWSFGKGFPAVIVELSFAAGETKTWQEIWDQKDDLGNAVVVGNYVAQGFMWTMQEAGNDAISAETETRSAQVSLNIK
jgi:hypothetical protein